MAGEHGSFSASLLVDNWIKCTFTGLLDYNIQAATYLLLSCLSRDAIKLSHFHCMRGWGTRNSMISLTLAYVSSDKGWQSLSPFTLVLLAGPIGLMATQATELTKTRLEFTGRCQSRLISKSSTYL